MKILIVSDVHANLTALEAVLAAAPDSDALWNLGDTVGYGPDPHQCLSRLSTLQADPALVGNHDLACIGALDLAEFNGFARQAAEWTMGRLTPDDRAYLAALPGMVTVDGVTLAHGSPRDPVWEYVLDTAVATANFARFAGPVCFVGHSHVALSAALGADDRVARLRPLRAGETLDLGTARHLVNPGSVGQPRDGDPRAAFAVLDLDRWTVTAGRVPYDVAATQRRMALAGLPHPLADRLARGR